jgi:hypothetical protein
MASRRLFDGAQIELGILPIEGAAAGAFTLVADGGTYTYSGNNANLVYTPAGAFTLSADGGTYTYTGNNANLLFNRRLAADGGVYSYSGNNANLTYTTAGAFVLQADGGVYTYSGNNANLLFSGTPLVTETRGGYGPPTKRKQRDFDEERREREQLREQIQAAVAPLKAKKAEVVETAAGGEEGVAILTRRQRIAIPVPASLDAGEVARMVSAALERAGIEARRADSERAQRLAAEVFELEVQERMRRIQRRRREEWLLLLN